jgi:hypothetical protein
MNGGCVQTSQGYEMTNGSLPIGHDTGPCEHWFAKVQIMGGPEMSWQMTATPSLLEVFMRQRMASLTWRAPALVNGETLIDFDYEYPQGFLDEYGSGEMRLTPNTGIYLARLTYGWTYELLEQIARIHPENTQIVVAFDHFRALPYMAGLPRDEGISRLTEACDIPLSRVLFPGEWRE